MKNRSVSAKRRQPNRHRNRAHANVLSEQKQPGASLRGISLQSMKISDLYRPLKKPVTLRLDADVIAWFKKDGPRYQSRINKALRRVMESEMKKL